MPSPLGPPEGTGRGSLGGRAFAVIGGGVVGLSLAREVSLRGGDVVVVDAGPGPGAASPAAAGILPQPAKGRSWLARLARAAHAGYPSFVEELEEESGVAIGLRTLGGASLALDEEEERRLRGQATPGPGEVWLSREELLRLVPGANPRSRGALFHPGTAWVSPARLLEALRRALERRGVPLIAGRAALAREADGRVVARLEGTRAESLAGREVLVAAGAWSGRLLGEAGLEPPAPLEPARGQILEADLAEPLETILFHDDLYVIPQTGGGAWVGATVEEVGFDARTTPEGILRLLDGGRRMLPGLGEPRRAWAGLRPKVLRRGGPLMGEGVPPVLAGHYRSGILLGPLSAHLVAARLAGETPSLESPTP